jgi:hypothetical protein
MRVVFLFLSLCLLHNYSRAAKRDTTGFYEIEVAEKRISPELMHFISGEGDSLRTATAWKVYRLLDTLLNNPSSYYYPFDSFRSKSVSIQDVPDGKFRLFTYNLILQNGKHLKFGYLQARDGKENTVYPLLDTVFRSNKDLADKELETTEWMGALYYAVFPFKDKKKKCFLLMGYDGATANSNKKVMDVLWFDKGNPVFGREIFKEGSYDLKPSCRGIYEFHNQSTMLLRYEADRKIVVLDKLGPAFPEAVNDFYYYIPSGDLDYYKWTKQGFWVRDALDNYDFGQGAKPKGPQSAPKPNDPGQPDAPELDKPKE